MNTHMLNYNSREHAITEAEHRIVEMLGIVYNEYTKLPVIHSQDKVEFMRAIHAAQNIVLARSALRQTGFGYLKEHG